MLGYKVNYILKPELKRINSTDWEYQLNTIKISNQNEVNAYFNLHKMIKSLSNSLTGLGPYIAELDDIPKYTTVYRGVKKKPPAWYIGYKFVFPEFISTSLDINVAKSFGQYFCHKFVRQRI